MLMWWPILSTMTACRRRLVGPNDQRGMWQACLTTGLSLAVTAASTAAAQHRHPPQDEACTKVLFDVVHAGQSRQKLLQ
jgi:hypothetical protein